MELQKVGKQAAEYTSNYFIVVKLSSRRSQFQEGWATYAKFDINISKHVQKCPEYFCPALLPFPKVFSTRGPLMNKHDDNKYGPGQWLY